MNVQWAILTCCLAIAAPASAQGPARPTNDDVLFAKKKGRPPVLHLLGFDHERLMYHHTGRDFRLTESEATRSLKLNGGFI